MELLDGLERNAFCDFEKPPKRTYQNGKETSIRRRAVRVEVKGKVIPTSSLKIKGRETFVGAKDRRERDS